MKVLCAAFLQESGSSVLLKNNKSKIHSNTERSRAVKRNTASRPATPNDSE